MTNAEPEMLQFRVPPGAAAPTVPVTTEVKVRVPPRVGVPDAEIVIAGVDALTSVEFEEATGPSGL